MIIWNYHKSNLLRTGLFLPPPSLSELNWALGTSSTLQYRSRDRNLTLFNSLRRDPVDLGIFLFLFLFTLLSIRLLFYFALSLVRLILGLTFGIPVFPLPSHSHSPSPPPTRGRASTHFHFPLSLALRFSTIDLDAKRKERERERASQSSFHAVIFPRLAFLLLTTVVLLLSLLHPSPPPKLLSPSLRECVRDSDHKTDRIYFVYTVIGDTFGRGRRTKKDRNLTILPIASEFIRALDATQSLVSKDLGSPSLGL